MGAGVGESVGEDGGFKEGRGEGRDGGVLLRRGCGGGREGGGEGAAWDPSICDALLGAGARLSFPPAPRQQQQQRSAATPSRKPWAVY